MEKRQKPPNQRQYDAASVTVLFDVELTTDGR
jgi:hypothetical protein